MNNRIIRPLALPLRALSLALALAAGTAVAAPDDRAMAPKGSASQALYWQGHEQLKQGRWEQALQQFVELERQLRRDEPMAADSALYWQAYAQRQGRRVAETRATVERLQREFPQSRWLADAQSLLVAPRLPRARPPTPRSAKTWSNPRWRACCRHLPSVRCPCCSG